jgi:hypothetical protein
MCANGNGGCKSGRKSVFSKAAECFLSNLPLVTLGAVMAVALLHEVLA